MKRSKIASGRPYHRLWWTAVLAGWLAAVAGAQVPPGTLSDADLFREYAQAGRVGGSVGVAGPGNQLQVKNGVAAYVTEDSVYIQPLWADCTLPICGAVCFARAGQTYAHALSTEDTLPPLGLLHAEHAANGAVTAVLALALPGDKVQRIEMQAAAGGTARFQAGTPISLSGQPGIRAFAGLPSTSAVPAEAFLALGLKGSLRRIERTPTGLAEVALVSGTSDDFLSQGEGWIGTAQGRIWRLRSGFAAPYLEVVPTLASGRAIWRIDAYIARLAPDGFFLNRGTHWTGSQPAVAGLVGVSPRWKSGGTWLELWLGTGSRSLEFGRAEETVRYRRSGGEWMPDSVLPPRYQGSGTWVYEISLRDPDRNLPAPEILFGHSDILTPHAPGGVAADPEAGCAATGWCLPGDETVMTLTLEPDSVSLSFPVLEGRREINPPCNTPVFIGERKQKVVSKPWKEGEWITIGESVKGASPWYGLDFPYGNTSGIGPGRKSRPPAARALGGSGTRPAWEARPGVPVDAGGRRLTVRALR